MNIDSAPLLRDVSNWRDEYQLAVARQMNTAAVCALEQLNLQLSSVGWFEGLRSVEATALGIVRPVLIERVSRVLSHALSSAADALLKLDSRTAAAAQMLREAKLPDLPEVPEQAPAVERRAWRDPNSPRLFAVPSKGRMQQSTTPAGEGVVLAPWGEGLSAAMGRLGELVEQAGEAISDAADQIESKARESSGFNARVRHAAFDEVRRFWIGPSDRAEEPVLLRFSGIL